MAEITNFSYTRFEDGALIYMLTPQAPIGGLSLKWCMSDRFGSEEPFVVKYLSSGLNGASGISVTNSGQGVFTVTLNSVDTSGLEAKNYATWAVITSSGRYKEVAKGFLVLSD